MSRSESPPPELGRIDIAAVIAGLRAGTAPDAWMGGWLRSTYADRPAFWKSLYASAAARRRGLKSSPQGKIDLYHDCVLAHVGQGRRAYVGRERGEEVSLSYEAVHALSGALMTEWLSRGAKAKQLVCVVLPVSADYVVALLTALRMGLVVCPLPPHGSSFVQNRVKALGPEAVITNEAGRKLLAGLEIPIWPAAGKREIGTLGSHACAPEDPALQLFSAYGKDPLAPSPVPAGALHAALLRDAMLVFALDDKDTLAMPGFEPLTCQPTSLLAALMGGACWAEIGVKEMASRPSALKDLGVTVLGVSLAARDAALARGAFPEGRIRVWFRSMTDPLDLDAWDRFCRLAKPGSVASFNAAFCPVAGGAILSGAVQREPLGLTAWPPAGMEFQLGEVGAAIMEARNDSGVHTPMRDEKAVEGTPRLLLARRGDAYMCTGSVDLGPEARAYPVDEVAAVAESHPEVRHATVVLSPGRNINEAHVTLVVFTDGEPGPDGRPSVPAFVPELTKLLAARMGETFSPSRVEVFPLRPRVGKEGLDRVWCRSQYLGGALHEKARSDVFLLLSRLGYMIDARPQKAPAKEGS